MITEALVEAGLVLFALLAQDTSTARAVSISIHLVNTYLLLASLTLTAWWASGGKPVTLRFARKAPWLLLIGLIGMLIFGMSGALTDLGDTLFPISSLAEGLIQDFSTTAHFLIRLRIMHPTIVILVCVYLIILAGWTTWKGTDYDQKILGRLLTFLLLLQLLAGLINVILLAPIWLQLTHLFFSDAIWITLVLFTTRTRRFEIEAQGGEIETRKVAFQERGI